MGDGGMAPLILTSALDGDEVSGQLHDPVALPTEKEPPVPIDRRLGGPQSRSGCCGVEKNLLLLSGIEPGRPAQAK
jgi:hypothetical protein